MTRDQSRSSNVYMPKNNQPETKRHKKRETGWAFQTAVSSPQFRITTNQARTGERSSGKGGKGKPPLLHVRATGRFLPFLDGNADKRSQERRPGQSRLGGKGKAFFTGVNGHELLSTSELTPLDWWEQGCGRQPGVCVQCTRYAGDSSPKHFNSRCYLGGGGDPRPSDPERRAAAGNFNGSQAPRKPAERLKTPSKARRCSHIAGREAHEPKFGKPHNLFPALSRASPIGRAHV